MHSYLVKYRENGRPTQIVVSDLNVAKQIAKEKDGKIFIADGKHTKSLDGIDIHHFDDESN